MSEQPMTAEECEAAAISLKHTGELPADRNEREYLVWRLLSTVTTLRAERDALRDAAREIRDFQQAGGSDWWDAHDRLYAVLDARHPPTEESR